MKKNINIRTNWKHAALEYQIRIYDSSQELSRTALFSRMVNAAKDVQDWNNVKLRLAKIKRIDDAPAFTSFQAKVEDKTFEKLEEIRHKILINLKDHIKVLQQQYMLQLLMCNYLYDLKCEVLNVGEKVDGEDINAADMVKILVEMILLDKQSIYLDKIKDLLVRWKNN